MYEDAQEIFDYLPINRSQLEADYIAHLRNAFDSLDNTENSARPFMVMPFHLLIMLALQFKGIRIAKVFPEAANLFFAGVGGRNKDILLSSRRVAFDLALINERTLPELFRLAGFTDENIQKTKSLIDDRNNNLAHAKGGIELTPNERIDQYLDALRTLQQCFLPLNNQIAREWLREIADEDDLKEFVDGRLLDGYLCLADFKGGALELFVQESDVPFDEWRAGLREALE
jgi:hypothetical protein